MSEHLPPTPTHEPAPSAPAAAPSQALAISALGTGLLGLLLTIIFLISDAGPVMLWGGFILGIVGLVLGIVALKKKQSKGMALTGLIAGIVAMLVAIALILFTLLFIGAFMTALS